MGIDRSAASVETANRRAAALGVPNVRFEAAELDTFDTAQMFDAVIGRLVLLYQPDPAATLRRFRKFLNPNGIMAFQEIDIDMSQVPSSELFNKVRSWITAALKAGGADTNMGTKLLRTFLDAGLPRPTMIAATRVESGPDSFIYGHHARILRSLLPVVERVGITTAEEAAIDTLADRLRQEAIAHERVMFESRMVGAWCRLPKS